MKRFSIGAAAAVIAALLAGAAFAQVDGEGDPGPHGERAGDRAGARMALQMLHAADADGDGSVTRAEVEALSAEMFAWLDRTGDGVLDLADRSPVEQRLAAKAEAAGIARPGGARRGRGGEGRFGVGDLMADGAVTRAEYLERGMPFFDRLDANGDDVVTGDEIEAAMAARERFARWWRAGE